MNMKSVFFCVLAVTVFSSCSNSGNGELVGVQGRKKFTQTDPFGMVYVPQGAYTTGAGGEDFMATYAYRPKTITIDAFYMDESEITNNEYRQFVYWVRDSIARCILADAGDEEYKWKPKGAEDANATEYNGLDKNSKDFRLNWAKKINWNVSSVDKSGMATENPLYGDDGLFLVGDDRFASTWEIDTRKLFYRYFWVDYEQAAKKQQYGGNKYEYGIKDGVYTGNPADGKYSKDGKVARKDLIRQEIVPVYPDTLCWMTDFAYSYNDPMMKSYFSHNAYDDYPVVGVSYLQAKAFANWRTEIKAEFARSTSGEPVPLEFRLPTEAEWEYAARGGNDLTPYPWGGPSVTTSTGCFLANFYPQRGNYQADGNARTAKTKFYAPNGYGLYDMAGNVAEWTMSTFDVATSEYTWSINPSFITNVKIDIGNPNQRKVVKGGSWKDIYYYIQVSARDFADQTDTKSYIGFRCVQTAPGSKLQ